VLSGGLSAHFGKFLLDATWVPNCAVRIPLDGGHRLRDLQPLRGGIDRLGQAADVVGSGLWCKPGDEHG
jgi:hypothetical protein